MRPRTGKLKDIARSFPKLYEAEEEAAQSNFITYCEVDGSDFIHKDEMRSLLLTLNLNLGSTQLEDYIEALNVELGADSSRSGEFYSIEHFKILYLLILRNQTTFFRELYSGKKADDIDLQ